MLLYDMPGTCNQMFESRLTRSQERQIEKAERRLTNIKYRYELAGKRCESLEFIHSEKANRIWNAYLEYTTQLEDYIRDLQNAIEETNIDKIETMLFWGLEYDKI